MQTFQTYEYPECADVEFVSTWSGWEHVQNADQTESEPGLRHTLEAVRSPANSQKLAEETRRTFEEGRAQGIAQGRELEKSAQALTIAKLQEERVRQTAQLVADFDGERNRYFQTAEQEVVKLALAVTARILRREAQADPLLLMGAVRVALGQIGASTEVRLRVPANSLDLWTEAIALLPNLGTKPEVLEGEGMLVGECVIETSLGSADLGIRSQLAAIERTMLDHRSSKDADPHLTSTPPLAPVEVSQ